jgi:NMD protein affecting ribosome stability and mRNA decay
MKKLRCAQCGKGTVHPVASAGRREWYKTMEVEVPADFSIPTCDHCGEEWLSVRQSQALDGVLETAYTAELVQLASQQLAKLAAAAIEQKRVEQLLGLSQGYLSHVKAGRHAPSPMLVTELVLLAKAPERRLKELEAFWKRRAA